MGETEGHEAGPAHRWALVTTIGLFSGVTLEAVVLLLEVFAERAVPDWGLRADRGDGLGVVMLLAFSWGAILGLAASVLTAISFLVWLYRAVRFAYARGLRPNCTPFGAVACWFIPFVNLVRPYNVVRSLHRVSTAADPTSRSSWARRWPWVFPTWWYSWIATILLRNLAYPSWSTADVLATASWIDIAALLCATVAAACAVTIIWSVQNGQQARAAAQSSSVEFIPPAGLDHQDGDDDVDHDDDDDHA